MKFLGLKTENLSNRLNLELKLETKQLWVTCNCLTWAKSCFTYLSRVLLCVYLSFLWILKERERDSKNECKCGLWKRERERVYVNPASNNLYRCSYVRVWEWSWLMEMVYLSCMHSGPRLKWHANHHRLTSLEVNLHCLLTWSKCCVFTII